MGGRTIATGIVVAGLLAVGASRARADTRDQRAESLRFDSAKGQWIELPPPVPGTPEGDLQIARAQYAEGDHSRAKRSVKKWLKQHGELHELYPAAMLLKARIRIAQRDYYKAHKELSALLAEFVGTEYADDAVNLEFIIAEVFLSGTKRKFLGMRILKADDVGLAILDDLANNHPGTNIAELAMLTKADYYYRTSDYPFAEHEYAALMREFPRSRYVRKAMLHSARSALASFPGVPFDDAPLIEAEERFSQYVSQYPGSAEQEGIGLVLNDISQTRAAKEFHVGRYYERVHRPRAAAFYYRSTRENWPDTVAALQAEERLRTMGFPLVEEAPGEWPETQPSAETMPAVENASRVKPGEPLRMVPVEPANRRRASDADKYVMVAVMTPLRDEGARQ